jgi:hypothetical protein
MLKKNILTSLILSLVLQTPLVIGVCDVLKMNIAELSDWTFVGFTPSTEAYSVCGPYTLVGGNNKFGSNIVAEKIWTGL